QTIQLSFTDVGARGTDVGDGNKGSFAVFGGPQFQLVLWRFGIGNEFNRLRLHTDVAVGILAVQLTVNGSRQLLHRAEFFIQRNQHRAAAVFTVGRRYGEVNAEAVGTVNRIGAVHREQVGRIQSQRIQREGGIGVGRVGNGNALTGTWFGIGEY